MNEPRAPLRGAATGTAAGREPTAGMALAGATVGRPIAADVPSTGAGGPIGAGSTMGHDSVDGGDGSPVAPDYEAAVAELESLVERMEDGRFALEESLAAYQRGVDLVRFCREQLAAVEQKVRVLEAGLLQPFEGESSADGDGGDR